MQVSADKNQNFNFSYTTSSGKNLSLSMFDNQSSSVLRDENGISLSLRKEYGFSFSYEGSRLSETDLAEIKNAFKEVEPLMNEFLESSKVGELEPKDFIKTAMKMADVLPTPSDENNKNAILDNALSSFDKLLGRQTNVTSDQKTQMLEDSKTLFEELRKMLEEQLQKLQEKLENKDDGLNLLA